MRSFVPSLLLFAAACATPRAVTAPPAEASVLPFIEDDYPRALAAARAKNVPLFVEAWAPW